MVQIRAAAAQELHRLLRHQTPSGSVPPTTAYLTLKPGGCADWTYCLTTATIAQQPTTPLACGDLWLTVPTAQLDLIKDLVIDYAEDLMGGGFRFVNPVAQSTCGCGNAFSLSADAQTNQDCADYPSSTYPLPTAEPAAPATP